MLEELSRPYGCYGIKTIEGFDTWVNSWLNSDGDSDILNNTAIFVNISTRHLSIWDKEVFNNER